MNETARQVSIQALISWPPKFGQVAIFSSSNVPFSSPLTPHSLSHGNLQDPITQFYVVQASPQSNIQAELLMPF